jgi:hypothetical protein
MKKHYFMWVGLALSLASVSAQSPASLFPGMEPFTSVGYDKYANPQGSAEDFEMVEVPVEEIDPSGVGYRFFIAEGGPPANLYEDVCPAGYETMWYTFESASPIPLAVGFSAQVQPAEGDRASYFNARFGDEYRERAGSPTHYGPVYLAFCAFSDTRGEYSRYHDISVSNESTDFDVEISCQISVNNSGNREILAEDSGISVVYCFGER